MVIFYYNNSINVISGYNELLLVSKIGHEFEVNRDFCKEKVVALHRFGAPVGYKKGGCWLQVAGSCSSQVQINVKFLGGSPGWLLLAGG